jgi:hypothetical protein
MMPRLSYVKRALLSVDEFAGALMPGSYLGETLSTHTFIQRNQQPWHALYVALDTLAPKHCERARAHDEERARALADYLHLHDPHGNEQWQ